MAQVLELPMHDLVYVFNKPHKLQFELEGVRVYWNKQLWMFETVLMLLWPWNVVKVTESGMKRLNSVITTIM